MRKRFLRNFLAVTILFATISIFSNPALALTCAWVSGGTRNWSDTAAWSGCGGGVPSAADDVTVSGTGTLTIDGTSGSPSLARSVNFTGFTGTLTHSANRTLQIGDGTTGHLVLVSGMTYSPNNSATTIIRFVSTTTGNQITTAGKTMSQLTFDGSGGSWQFQDNVTLNTAASITLTTGTLDANGKTIVGNLSSSGTGTRSLTLGAASWTFPSSWDIGTSTNMTFSGASATIIFSGTTATGTFNGGGLTYGTLTATARTSGNLTISQANTFSTLTLKNGANKYGYFAFGANQTVSGTCDFTGNSIINRNWIRSSVRGTARTVSCATFTASNIDFEDFTLSGASSPADISASSAGNCGGNSNITFTTPVNRYWVSSGGTSTGSTSATTRWAATSGGAGGQTAPLCHDTAYFDASSIDAGSRTITEDIARIGDRIWTGVTNTPAWAKTTQISAYGDITMVAGMTNSGTAAFDYRDTGTFTTGGLTWTNPLTVDAGSGTVTQGDNFASSSTLTGTTGTWAGASTYTTSFTTATWNGGTFTETGNMTLTGALSVTGGTFMSGVGNVSGGTTSVFSGGTSNLKGFSGTSTQVSGGNVTIGSTGLAGTALTVSGGTFNLNGASTGMTGSVTVSGGTWNLNANYTTSSNTFNHATAIGTINLTGATLTIGTVLAVAGVSSGSGLSANPVGGFVH